MTLREKNVLITGAAKRIGRMIAISLAQTGVNIALHYGKSEIEAKETAEEIRSYGCEVKLIQGNLAKPDDVHRIFKEAGEIGDLYGLVNNASIFEPLSLEMTDLDDWNRHLAVNLTAPFLLSKQFAHEYNEVKPGRIINILDWRAVRPGADHFPYTISKSGLAALTKSMAISLAPKINVNGIALGAILPPSDGSDVKKIIEDVPAGRWANQEELVETVKFLLFGPAYITGEILFLDGGRHLI